MGSEMCIRDSPMWDLHFSPLITLEVFSLDDFLNSHQAMLESHERYITKH